MSPEGFSELEKNVVICPQRAILPIQSDASVRYRLKWSFGAIFVLFELAGTGVAACCKLLYNGCFKF